MKTLALIGAGKVGQSLARLWHTHGVFKIMTVTNRTEDSAARAVAFIGTGTPAKTPAAADIYMIAVPDTEIESCARTLKVAPDSIIFHCSGAYPSTILNVTGAKTASLHPFMTFATPLDDFSGVPCALEGHPDTVSVLSAAVTAIGGQAVPISTTHKEIYHAAAVFSCNYLPVLIESGLRCLEKAGIEKNDGMNILMPIIRRTIDNIEANGPAASLTGPIARGDSNLIEKQFKALHEWSKDLAALYAALGIATTELSSADPGEIQKITEILKRR